MAVTVIWLVLIGAAILWEIACHRSGSQWTSLSEIGARLCVSRPGRLVLVALWGFVGWHVFARYTLPG
jgi:Family of unknown function (DUF6186)